MNLKADDIANITVWNLRGLNIPFEELSSRIVKIFNIHNLDMVILDPIYKCFTGSENDQETVTNFCNNLDLIAKAGASVVYCHHHSKGIQGGKDPMDRGSGSGVFARDADAILDLLKIDFDASSHKQIDPEDQTVSAWELTGVLREFAPFEKKQIYYRYPLHEVCTDGRLDDAKPQSKNRKGGNTRGSQKATEAVANYKRFTTAYEKLSADGQPVKIKDIAGEIGMSDKTIRTYAATGGFVISKGKVLKEGNKEAPINEDRVI